MILTFKPQFVEAIKSRQKIGTLRKPGRWKAGMKIDFWCNNPRNVHLNPYKFGTGYVAEVLETELDFIVRCVKIKGCYAITSSNVIMFDENKDVISKTTIEEDLDKFAQLDGFKDFAGMAKFFNCESVAMDWIIFDKESLKFFDRNPVDAQTKIIKTIRSCKTAKQLISAGKMLGNYIKNNGSDPAFYIKAVREVCLKRKEIKDNELKKLNQ